MHLDELKKDIDELKAGHRELSVSVREMAVASASLATSIEHHIEQSRQDSKKFANLFDRVSTLEKSESSQKVFNRVGTFLLSSFWVAFLAAAVKIIWGHNA